MENQLESGTYLSALRQQPPHLEALILGGNHYSYKELTRLVLNRQAQLLAKPLTDPGKPELFIIQTQDLLTQLIDFLACSGTGRIPVIVPWDLKIPPTFFTTEIPPTACMATVTSGTTGTSKLLFRSFESWHSYFPIQNQIFGMGKGSRIFMQGSLAFTGNLNYCMAQLSSGGAILAEKRFDPRLWMREIETYGADTIYLIPAKLRALQQVYQRENVSNPKICALLSGSQSLGGKEAAQLLEIFPNARLFLYYGASELNYITYVEGSQMCQDRTLIGKPFPQVQVRIEDGKILVTTAYGAIGFGQDSFIGDYGHFDGQGFLYFDGRRDDLYSLNGRKVSAIRTEQALNDCPEIAESAVKTIMENGRDLLAAWVVLEPGHSLDETALRRRLSALLSPVEIPRKFTVLESFPRNESGKILKRELGT